MIDQKYRFTYDDEPSIEDLNELMHEIALDAKQQALLTQKKLLKTIQSNIENFHVHEPK